MRSMRKLARRIARRNMEREGVKHLNRRLYGWERRSLFSYFWRNYAMKGAPQESAGVRGAEL